MLVEPGVFDVVDMIRHIANLHARLTRLRKRSSRRLLIVIAAAGIASMQALPAQAEPAVAAFAPGQLRLAASELAQAQEALAQRDYARARQLAFQAGLDARIAYRMTDSAFLRRDAMALHEQSARLRWLAAQPNVSALR